ncbi:MAG: iron-sulfur cluster assembly scaffold protein [Planctomycetota bacterium]
MTEESAIYEDHILRHYEQPYHNERFASATHRQRVDNPVCGDSVQLELQVSAAGVIEQAWFTGTGCVISQASASMLAEHIEGQTLEALSSFNSQDMLRLFRARLTPRRQQCCLLAWQALRKLIDKLPTVESAGESAHS